MICNKFVYVAKIDDIIVIINGIYLLFIFFFWRKLYSFMIEKGCFDGNVNTGAVKNYIFGIIFFTMLSGIINNFNILIVLVFQSMEMFIKNMG